MITIFEYYIKSNKIPKEVTFAALSDLHIDLNDTSLEHLDIITRLLKQSDYDYTLIPGDLINDSNYLKDNKFYEKFTSKILDLTNNKLCFITEGNHDIMTMTENGWRGDSTTLLKDSLNRISNIVYLDKLDNYRLIESNINISGVSLPFSFYEVEKEKDSCFLEYLEKIKNKNQEILNNDYSYNILLLHAVKNYLELSKKNINILSNIDFILGGHYHYGLIPSFITNVVTGHHGLISPQMELFPKHVRGIEQIDNTKFISMAPVNYRVENPIINKLFGTNLNFIHLIPEKNWNKSSDYYCKKRTIK